MHTQKHHIHLTRKEKKSHWVPRFISGLPAAGTCVTGDLDWPRPCRVTAGEPVWLQAVLLLSLVLAVVAMFLNWPHHIGLAYSFRLSKSYFASLWQLNLRLNRALTQAMRPWKCVRRESKWSFIKEKKNTHELIKIDGIKRSFLYHIMPSCIFI